jgi:hypothetical protein
LPLYPRFTVPNLAEKDGFLKAIKFHSTTSFERKVKPTAPCHKILWNVKKPLCILKEILCRQNSRPFLPKFLPASLLGVSAGYCQRALVDESGIIRNQVGNAQ